jgi:hypothetical protein
MAGPTRIVSDRANEAKKTTKKKPEAMKSKKAEAEAAAAAAAAEAAAAKDKGSSGYGSYGQSKKVKKKVRSDRHGWPPPHASAQHGACALSPQVEKVVVEETISPFAQSPLMVAMSTLQVRQGPTP